MYNDEIRNTFNLWTLAAWRDSHINWMRNTAHGAAVSRLRDCGGSSILSSYSASHYCMFKVGLLKVALHRVKTGIKEKEKQKKRICLMWEVQIMCNHCLGAIRCCYSGRVQLPNIYKYFSNGVSSVGANPPRHLSDSGIPGLTLYSRNFSTREPESLRIWWAFCITRSLTSCTTDDLLA